MQLANFGYVTLRAYHISLPKHYMMYSIESKKMCSQDHTAGKKCRALGTINGDLQRSVDCDDRYPGSTHSQISRVARQQPNRHPTAFGCATPACVGITDGRSHASFYEQPTFHVRALAKSCRRRKNGRLRNQKSGMCENQNAAITLLMRFNDLRRVLDRSVPTYARSQHSSRITMSFSTLSCSAHTT